MNALLMELAEAQGGALHEHLEALRAETIQKWTDSPGDREDLILKGEKRILDRLIDEIQTAPEKLRRERAKNSAQIPARKPMSNAF